MIVKGGFVHVAFALIKRITIVHYNTSDVHRKICHAMHGVHLAARMPEAFLNMKRKQG